MKKILSVFLAALLLLGMLPWTPIHAAAATAKYVKVTKNLTDWSGRYLIVYETGKKAMNGGLAVSSIDADNNTINVTISDNAIEATDAVMAAEFTIASDGSGKYTIRSSKNGYYIGRTGSSNGMDENASTAHKHTISYNGSNVVITSSGGPTLQAYQSGSTYRFRYYKSSQKAIALYKLEETVACQHPNTTEKSDGYAATCTAPGKTNSVVCDDCGETVTPQKEIAATGHNYVDGECQNCGNELPVISFVVPAGVDAIADKTTEEDGTVNLPTAGVPTGDYDYTFAGWTTGTVDNETNKPATIYTAGNTQFTEKTTLYALYTYTVAGEGSGETTWNLVTDASSLGNGDEIVIVATGADYAMSATQGSNNRDAASVSKNTEAKTVSFDAATVQIITIETIAGSDYLALATDEGYLYAASSGSNYLRSKTTLDTNGYWSIEVTSAGVATIKAHGSYTRNWLRYNTTSTLFSCYSSGQADVSVYKKNSGSSGTTYYTTQIIASECSHQWDDGVITEPAACETAGVMTYTCQLCGETYTEPIAATDHTEVVDAGKEPTCVESGLTAGSHCSVCDKVITAQEVIPATGEHNYVDGTCSVCGATTIIVEIPEIPESGIYQLVTDLDEIKLGGQFVVVVNGNALGKTLTNSKLNAVPVDIINNLVYTPDAPTWIVGKYGENIVLIDGEEYLKHSSSTNLSTVKDVFAWNLTASENKEGAFYVVSSSDDTRALAYRTTNIFGAYAMSNITNNSTEYLFDVEFYKLVEGELVVEQSTLSFNENGTDTVSEEVNVGSIYTMPAPLCAAPEGYSFAGWVSATVNETAIAPENIYAAGAQYKVGTDAAFYALYIRQEETESDAGGIYKLITDISELAVGQKVIIANKDMTYAIGTTQGSNNRPATAISLTDGVLVPEDTVQILTLEAGEIDGTFAFCVSEGKYLAAASSGTNNRLYTQAMSEAASFSITLTDGVFAVVSKTASPRNTLKFNPNSGSPIFACYASGQTDVVLLGETSGTTTVTYYTTHVHTVVVDEAVAAGCETTGLTEGSHCSVCNEVLTAQQEIPALGHSYVGTAGYYINEAEKQIPRITYLCGRCDDSYNVDLKFNAGNVELKNTLIINFMAPEEVAQHFTDIRAEFIYGNRVGEYQLPPVTLEDAKYIANRYAFPCRYITPSQVGDTVYAYLYGTYDGVEYCFTMEYSVSTYCYRQLSNTSNATLQTLLVDLLYYCDYARVYTNYKANESVTAVLTDEQKAMASTDRELTSILNSKYVVIDNPTISWKGANLALNHATRMQIRFAVAEGTNASDLTVQATIDGKPIVAYVVESPDYSDQYIVMIDEIEGHQMSDQVCVTLYNGDTAVSNTVCYSIESYACAKQSDKNVKLANLVKAMMRYGRSANAYIEP